MDYLPLFMDVSGRRVLLVGGGDAAARKASLLLRAGACVRVVAPWLCDALAQLRTQARIEHDPGPFCTEHLYDACIVLAATDDGDLNRRVSRLAIGLNIPVNVVDSPRLCTFIMPAIVDRSPLIVAVSSAGTSPVLTTMIRARIEALLEPGVGRVAQWAGRWRERVKSSIPGGSARRNWWERILNGPLACAVAAGDERTADAQLQALLDDAQNSTRGGRVALMGAGRGRADLLTLRAARLLRQADVVVHDRDVAADILELARRDAVCIDVSRRRRNAHITHNKVGELLIQLVGEGRQVVRIKGGGSFEFSPTGDEIEALASAGIDFEVVPGVSRNTHGIPTARAAPAAAA